MSDKLLRNGIVYSVANALSAGVPFLLLPVLTRALSPGDYGQVISFFMLASLCTSLAGLSVHGAVAVKWFERANMDLPRFVGAAIALATASTIICGLVLYGASFALQTRLDLAPRFWFLSALQSGAAVILGVRTSLWQSQGRALSVAFLQVASATINVMFSLSGVFLFGLGGSGRIYGSVLSSLLIACIAVWLLLRQQDARWSATRADVTGLLRFGAPLIPHALAGALMATMDRFSVANTLGQQSLGVYGTAAQLGMVMAVLGDAFIKTFSPWIYAQMAAKSMRARLRVVAATYLLIPTWILVALAMWLLLKSMGGAVVGARYLPAIDLSIYFLLGGAVTAIYLNVAGLFFFTGKTEWLSLATVATAVSAVLLAPFLASRFGLTGAALAYLSVQCIGLTLSWALSTRVQPMPWSRPSLAMRTLSARWRQL
jgi:O-antigen/teichoic acid export membrane protein